MASFISVEIGRQISVASSTPMSAFVAGHSIKLNELVSYSHNTTDVDGYDTCEFTISGEPRDLFNSWLRREILMRRMFATNEYNVRVFEGFIDSVTATFGPITATIGPAMDIVNRAKAGYRTIRYDTNPPVGGDEAETDWIQSNFSVDMFGAMSEVIEVGECSEQEAIQQVMAHLADFSTPKSEVSLSIGSGNSEGLAEVTISCKGYIHLLDKEIHEEEDSGEEDVDVVLTEVLSGSGLIDYVDIEANSIPVGVYDKKNRTIRDVVSDTVSYGSDSSDTDKYAFGMYDEATAVYKKVRAGLEYVYNPFLPEQEITNLEGQAIPYSEIKPASYMYIAGLFQEDNFVPLRTIPAFTTAPDVQNLRLPVYISSISYSWPDNTIGIEGRGAGLTNRIARRFGVRGK